MSSSTRMLATCAAALAIASLLAGPAAARINHPIGTVVTASSMNPRFTYGPSVTRCTRADFSGTVTAATNITGTLTMGGSCTTATIISSVTCTGTVTLEITRSPVDLRSVAEGVMTLDGNYQCSIRPSAGGCDITFVGLQQRLGRISYDNRQGLTFNVANVATTASGATICGPVTGAGTLEGLYFVLLPRMFQVAP